MKILVTHMSPDLDALASVWLIKRFIPGWQDAEIKFVPAGKTLNDLPPDDNPEIIHTDTGLGKFDHHQSDAKTCATEKVLNYLKEKNFIKQKLLHPLEILVEHTLEDDHFSIVNYPEADNYRYDFLLYNLIDGLKITLGEDKKLAEQVFTLLDGILEKLKNRVIADSEVKKGLEFQSYLGKSFAIESKNDEILALAQKIGYKLVVRKDPSHGNIRIKCPPVDEFDLTPIYNKILKVDTVGSWFFHSSKHMLLNGSPKRPDQTPSPLSLTRLIELIKGI